ncbi:MAG: 16S rRNA (cytosine(1402)-N(4))-methyltransferase [Acidobacteria bacterium]|nr:MAG: 16S rRNA (cytosine(1402)-N(4))-methyltransferase [Acidobacteriota bacterium]
MEKGTHRPVLLREAVAALGCRPGGFWVDGTVGAGGHAEAILRASAPDGRLLGLDRDREALERARRLLAPFGDRVALRHDDFRSLPEILEASGRPPDGILLDLGISSQQIDDPARGFSFQEDGPLDMRMDRTQDTTAATLVNALPARELAAIVARYGEEPAARRIARALVAERAREPITTTGRLAAIVARVARSRRRTRTHPATRTFQALRIAVNRELDGLDRLIEQAVERLPPGGRIAVISFHSLEDRIVKRALRALARRCVCPRDLPLCACGRPDLARLLGRKPVRPGAEEARDNPRSRSARLRAAERLPGGTS